MPFLGDFFLLFYPHFVDYQTNLVYRDSLITPEDKTIIFNLNYKNLLIGVLKLENGIWSFQYSEDFKNQNKVKVLPDFPNIKKVYESKELYPFFLHRIPSQKQPKVRQKIKENHIDAANEVELLRFFGKKSISNPFLLQSV